MTITSTLAATCQYSGTYYNPGEPLGTYLASTGQPYSPLVNYDQYVRVFNASTFQALPAQKLPNYQTSNPTCTSDLCTCSLTTTANDFPLYPGLVASFEYNCNKQAGGVNLYVSSIEPQYKSTYMYSTSLFSYQFQEEANCVSTCYEGSCLPIYTSGNPFYYTLNAGFSNGPATCCNTYASGYLVAGVSVVPNFAYELAVYKLNYVDVAVIICEQQITNTYCYDASKGTSPMVVTFNNVPFEQQFTVGVLMKNGVPIQTIIGNFPEDAGSATWGQLGDYAYIGKTSDCTPLNVNHPSGTPVTFGDWIIRSCDNPLDYGSNYNYLSGYTGVQPGLFSFVNSANSYNIIQKNPYNLRPYQLSLTYSNNVPIFTPQFEYIDTTMVAATISYSNNVAAIGITNSDWSNAISTIALTGCYGTLGGSISGYCELDVSWKGNTDPILVYVKNYASAYSTQTNQLYLESAYTKYKWRTVFFSSVSSVKFDVYNNGNKIVTLSTTNINLSPRAKNDTTTNYVVSAGNVAAQENGVGNYAIDGINLIMIILLAIFSAIILAVLLAGLIVCAKSFHEHRMFNKKIGVKAINTK